VSVREAKSRRLTREYMADREFMTKFTATEREWYLLTSLFADDSGYLPWDLADNAANLYRYEVPSEREARVAAIVAHFISDGRLVDLGCGHAVMRRVAKSPRGMTREYGVRDEHSSCATTAVDSSTTALDSSLPPIPSLPIPSSPSRDSSRTAVGQLSTDVAANGQEAAAPPVDSRSFAERIAEGGEPLSPSIVSPHREQKEAGT
jgi:hypothetical protein